jgi:hypothetical protein
MKKRGGRTVLRPGVSGSNPDCPRFEIGVVADTACPPDKMFLLSPRKANETREQWAMRCAVIILLEAAVDKKRYKWRTIEKNEKWLVDSNEFNRVIGIVSKGRDELEEKDWWGVFTPFKKKGVAQFEKEEDATKYAEEFLAQGEKEERVSWES